MAKSKYLVLVSLFCCCALPQSLNATLLIGLRNNDVLYVASDGMISVTGAKPSWKYLKCFPVSKTSCVAITGYGGADGTITTTTSNQLSFALDFPPIMHRIATEEYAKQESFSEGLSNFLSRFAIEYKSLMNILETNNYLAQERLDDTDIYFMGYDTATAMFCCSEARFHPIAPYSFDLDTTTIPPSRICFKGEFAFLSALMRGDNPRLKALRSRVFDAFPPDSSAADGRQAKAISDRILRLYALHTEYSKRYNYDHGLVGPPYVVYRISTNDVKRVCFGNGFATSDEKFVDILMILMVLFVVGGAIIFGCRS